MNTRISLKTKMYFSSTMRALTLFALVVNAVAFPMSTAQAQSGGIELFASGFSGPFGMTFDGAGYLYVANEIEGGDSISKILPDGTVSTFTTGLTGASGLAFNSLEELYASDDTNQIFQIDSSGTSSAFIDETVGLTNPNAIAFDSADNLYVANAGGFISKFNSSGGPVDLYLATGFNVSQAVLLDEANNRLFTSDFTGQIYQVNLTTGDWTVYVNTFRTGSQGGLVMDADGNLFYSAYEDDAVLRIDAATQAVTVCLSGISRPRGLVFDSSGWLYVTSYDTGAIYRAEGCGLSYDPDLSPDITAAPSNDWISGEEWPINATITIEIDDPNTSESPDFSTTQIATQDGWRPDQLGGNFQYWSEYDFSPGDTVTLSDGITTKSLVVSNVQITALDVDGDVIAGVTDPNRHMWVFVHGENGVMKEVDSDTSGYWSADFTGEYDIRPGTSGSIKVFDDDQDMTHADWQVPNPTFGVRANDDRIEGWEWPDGATLTITVDDPTTQDNPDATESAMVGFPDWDPSQTYFELNLWDVIDIQPGFFVTVTDGVTTKEHTVLHLTFTDIDTDNDIVNGTGQLDSPVNIWTCDDFGCDANREEFTDGAGNWSTNFSVPGDQDWENVTADLGPGTWIDSSQSDEDGDQTQFGMNVPNPHMIVFPENNSVEVWGWPDEATVDVSVDGKPQCTTSDMMSYPEWDPSTTYTWINFPEGCDVAAGDLVAVTDGETARTHEVQNLTITVVNAETDIIAGMADPGTEVNVWPHGFDEFGLQPTADGAGNWTADFTTVGYDVQPGTDGGRSEVRDENGNSTAVDWNVTNPTFGVRANDDRIEGWEWPDGATITITIDDPATSQNPDATETTMAGYPDWDSSQTRFELDLWNVIDIQPGFFVTVTDGLTTKEHTVLDLVFTDFDTDADVVQGIGQSNSTVNVWTCDDNDYCVNREEFTDGAGNWSADFSVPGDQDWELETADLRPGSWVDSSQNDEDGDQTQFGMNILNYTLHTVPTYPEVHGHDWAPGSDVTLIIDDDADPYDDQPLYTRTQYAGDNDTWCGEPCFDLSGEFDPADAFDLEVGQYVTMTDGNVSRTVLVSRLTITEVDHENDILRGIADPGSRVAVNIWSQEGLARYVTTQPDGTWEADFSVFGDEDFEQFTTDIDYGDHGRAIQLNPDGSDDGTMEYWYVEIPIWEAPDSVPLVAALPFNPDLNRIDWDGDAWMVANLLWEPLFRTTAQGELMFAAASDYTVSPDGLTYTITLRNDAVWSDGTPVTAGHYVDGFLRLIAPDTAVDYGYQLYEIAEIAGAEDYSNGTTTDPNSVGLIALNDLTLQITLHSPASHLPKILANPGMVPVRTDLINQHGGAWVEPGNFVGNGPYTLLEHDGSHLLLEKNQNFRDASLVEFSQIGFAVIPDEEQRLNAYREGIVDVITNVSTDAAKDPELSAERHTRAFGIYYVGLNTQKPPLDNLLVRKALASAIDRDYLFNEIFETPWTQTATGVVPPDIPGYQGGAVGYAFNPTQAQAYLSDAGYPGGAGFPEIVLYVDDVNGELSISMEYVAEQWRTVLGIPVRVEYIESNDYFAYLNGCHGDPASCDYNAYRLGWLVDYHDPYNILGEVFHPDSHAQYTGWDSTLYRSLINLSLSETDPAQRTDYLQQAEQVLVEDEAAVIPVAFTDRISFIKPMFDPAFGTVPYLDLWNTIPMNQPPTDVVITAPVAPLPITEFATVQVDFADPDEGDDHAVVIDWGDETTTNISVTELSAMTDHQYQSAGVYTIEATVTDSYGEMASATYQYVVVYDPDGGFVTGGGWIWSPEGAYVPDPSLTGKATFGFVSKYKKGANVPTGNTEFQFKVADLNFKSTSYDWLVIAGSKAKFKGTGTINGTGEYKFMLSAIDGSPDKFRIKIWEAETGLIVYDNMLDADDTADPATEIQGGSIVVHKAK